MTHERVKLYSRIYEKHKQVSDVVRDWVSKSQAEKEDSLVPQEVIESLRRDKRGGVWIKDPSARLIIGHVAGMTD